MILNGVAATTADDDNDDDIDNAKLHFERELQADNVMPNDGKSRSSILLRSLEDLDAIV